MKKSREQILAYLKEHKDELRDRFGVTRLGLSGSYARDEATEQSDIDIIVSLQSSNSFRSFFGLLHFLQDNLDERIDLATEESLKPRVKASVLRDIHYV
ncbi:MAG: nucleotidyltransferase family protein [Desulfuromonadales bacterium]